MEHSKRFVLMLALLLLAGCSSGAPLPDDFTNPGDVEGVGNLNGSDSVQFFAFGDWGSGSDNQIAVADALTGFCATETCDFGLLLGDNFYESGVASVDDPQWQSKFEEVYSQPSLQLPFFAVLGNHDHDGNAQAEIDYTSTQDRWKMPGSRYRIRFPSDSEAPLLEIFVIDSVYGDPLPTEALDNLAAELDSSQATWKILAMHHPLYSNGRHGDTSGLKSTLVPVICNRVDAVISGHDHLFTHLDDPDDGCRFHQWVVGTGGKALYSAHKDPRVIFSDDSDFGFASFQVQPDSLVVKFHATDQGVRDTYLLPKGQ